MFLLYAQFEEVADKDDLMGIEDTAKRNILYKPPFSSDQGMHVTFESSSEILFTKLYVFFPIHATCIALGPYGVLKSFSYFGIVLLDTWFKCGKNAILLIDPTSLLF